MSFAEIKFVPFACEFATYRIAVGSQPNSEGDVAKLLEVGITHIINVCMEDDPLGQYAARVSYLWNASPDDGSSKPPDWFYRSIDFATPMLLDPLKKLFVHCRDGINRGPSTAYAILRVLGITKNAAAMMIALARPIDTFGMRYIKDADAALAARGY